MDWIFTVEESLPWFLPVGVFILGLLCGSFLNVCIYRIPEGRSVIWPPSACQCGQKIPAYLNIPILSWLFLSGKAACCGRKIPARYPLVEFITALLFYLSWIQKEPTTALVGMAFFGILIAATFIDFDHMIIPDCFSIGGTILGIGLSVALPQIHGFESGILANHWNSWIASMLGVLVGTSLVYWISVIAELILKKPAMGEGDIKFLACIGAFTGWQGAIFALFGGAFIGTISLIPFLIKQRISTASSKSQLGSTEVPFGPMLALGAIVYFLFLENQVYEYFAQVNSLFTL